MQYSCWSCPSSSSSSSSSAFRLLSIESTYLPSFSSPYFSLQCDPSLRFSNFTFKKWVVQLNRLKLIQRNGPLVISSCRSDSTTSSADSSSPATAVTLTSSPPAAEETTSAGDYRVMRKRTRYRKQYPGEKEGITEEMRFVAMRLRNVNGKKVEETDDDGSIASSLDKDGGGGESWQPTIEGFLKYLVDSKLVFDTVERIVDESDDVSYAYFRKTGLERSEGLSKDIEWFSQQDMVIPPPSNPGVSYVTYLEELAEKNPPLFLCHFYNIYFSHIAGGQVIAKQVSEKLFEGRELNFYKWEGSAEELLKGVRDKLNMLGEHWSRDEKNKCLREATKCFRYLGQIVRMIIL